MHWAVGGMTMMEFTEVHMRLSEEMRWINLVLEFTGRETLGLYTLKKSHSASCYL